MKNAIIVHEKPTKEIYYSDKFPSSSNFAWIPWLQKQLIINDVRADTPEMPHAYNPDYEIWRTELERFDVTENTLLIGHSVGAGFLLRWLSANPKKIVSKLLLVAPSAFPPEGEQVPFLDFSIDPKLSKRANEIVVFTSKNDSPKAARNVEMLREKIIGVRVETFENYGHFIPDHMGTNEFPELLRELLK